MTEKEEVTEEQLVAEIEDMAAFEADVEAIEKETTEETEAKLGPSVREKVKAAVKKRKAPTKKRKKTVNVPGPHAKVDQLLGQIRKKHPTLVIGRGTDPEMQRYVRYRRSPFSFPQLNALLSHDGNPENGGGPHGRYITMWGVKSSGKTALAMDLIMNYLDDHPDEYVLVLDAENAVDANWYAHFGIDQDRVLIIPGTLPLEDMATQGLRVLKLCHEQEIKIGIVLVDSLGAMSPVIEMEGKKEKRSKAAPEADLRQDHIGTRARKIGQFLRTWSAQLLRSDAMCVLIAHATTDIMGGGFLKISGGNALEHWSHAILRVSRKNDQMFDKEIICKDGEKRTVRTGHFCVIKIDKTRMSDYENHTVRLPFLMGIGFQTNQALLGSAVGHGIIEQKGAWYAYNGENIAQGKTKAILWIANNREQRLEIESKLATAMYDKGEMTETSGSPIVRVSENVL